MLTDSSGRITRTTRALIGTDFVWAVMTNNQRATTAIPYNKENKANVSIPSGILEQASAKTEANITQQNNR
jgi:hypothetical protein